MMTVDFQSPRKMNTTNITTKKVMRMVSIRVRMVLMISVEPSTMVVIRTSAGRSFSILASSRFTPRMTLTVLASLCFWMMMRAARRPLV